MITTIKDFKVDFTILVKGVSDFIDTNITDSEIVYVSGLVPRTIELDKFYKIEINKKKLTYLFELIEYYLKCKSNQEKQFLLQYIGDYCLLLCSLFEKFLNRKRRADLRNFYIEGGKNSYRDLANLKRDEMFFNLSKHFLECCELLKMSLDLYNREEKHAKV